MNAHTRIAGELGMKEHEIIDVQRLDDGAVVVLGHDGQRKIRVPAHRPDATGKTGWMWLVKPSPGYSGTYPVYDPGDVPLELAVPGLADPPEETKQDRPVPASIELLQLLDGDPHVFDVFDVVAAHWEGDRLVASFDLRAEGSTPANTTDIPSKAADVIEWIGNDIDRARRALNAENAIEKPRTTVVARAEAVIAADEGSGTDA